jgi:hypothetical protein
VASSDARALPSRSGFSRVANGLLLRVAGEQRHAVFTSSRFVEYAVAPLLPSQIRVDVPYLTANRTDLAGRDYGLVAPDPGSRATSCSSGEPMAPRSSPI